jgi:hypothetical protein
MNTITPKQPLLALAIAACLATTVSVQVSAQERAGRTTEVQPDAFQATGAVGISLANGDEVFRQARVYTRQYGTMEIRLEDGTNLTVAPNASLIIDEFVFSGNSGPNTLAISLAKGAVRMASGRMPKDSVAIKTSVATIGIRGTEFWLNAEDPALLQIWVLDGTVLARPEQSTTEFAFDAPAYATCSATSCEAGEAPPVPPTFPNNPSGRQTGDSGVDDGESESSSGQF